MAIDAVICTKDRPEELAACLRSLAGQSVPPARAIVVDASTAGAAGDEPASLPVERHPSPPGLPRQRNLGLALARADLVAFLDDDVELEPGYLEAIGEWFEGHPDCVGASGHITNDPVRPASSRLFRRIFCLANDDGRLRASGDAAYLRHPVRPTRVDFVSGSNMVFRRDRVADLRFDEALEGYAYMEDVDFSLRARRRGELWMVPAARLAHHKTVTARIPPRPYVRQVFGNSAALFVKHREACGLRRLAFARRLAGRALAYLALSVAGRSWEPALGTALGLRDAAVRLRGGVPAPDV